MTRKIFSFIAKDPKMENEENTPQEIPFPTEGEQTYYFNDFFQSYYSGRERDYIDDDYFNYSGELNVFFSDKVFKIKVQYTDGKKLEIPLLRLTDSYSYKDAENNLVKSYVGIQDDKLAPQRFIFQISKNFAILIKEFNIKLFLDFNGLYAIDRSRIGSGFAINPNTIVTSTQIVNGNRFLYASREDFSLTRLEPIYIDFNLELAILKSRQNLKACALNRNVYDIGEEVLAYGFPDPKGRSVKAAKGIISSRKGFRGEPQNYQLDMALQNGNSGGPIVRNGKVIGIVSSVPPNCPNVGTATKSCLLGALLDSLGIPNTGTRHPIDSTYAILSLDENHRW